MPTLYHKSTCSTCRKARALLDELNYARDERDLGKQPLSRTELESLFAGRELKPFVNTRTDLYRERKMKDGLPPREELLDLMAGDPNLIRRPLLVHGDQYIAGLDEDAYRRLAAE